jgi:type IV pilus assembly protein PilW
MVTRHPDRLNSTNRAAGESGFTLIELLVVTVVSLLVVGGLVTASKQVQEGYGQQFETAAAEQEARYALDWIQRLLRQAGSNPFGIRTSACVGAGLLPSVSGFPAIVRDPDGNGIDDDIRVLSDSSSPDGLLGGPGPAPGGCTEANEDMTIAYSAANRNITLRDRNQPALGAQVMTDNVVTSLRFVYRDRNHVASAVMSRVAWVQVTLATQARLRNPQTGQFPTFNVTVDVRLRPRW